MLGPILDQYGLLAVYAAFVVFDLAVVAGYVYLAGRHGDEVSRDDAWLALAVLVSLTPLVNVIATVGVALIAACGGVLWACTEALSALNRVGRAHRQAP